MPSPPRSLRHSPPRRPLHERSESSTNERVSPTLRIIGDPHAPIYSGTPFPTHPSQVLPPKTTSASGAVLDKGVSSEHDPTDVYESSPRRTTPSPTANTKDDGNDLSGRSGETSAQHALGSSQRLSPSFRVTREAKGEEDSTQEGFTAKSDVEDRPSDEIVQLPSVGHRSKSQLFTQNVVRSPYQQPVLPKSSDNSLSSSDSAGTVIRKHPERPTRPFYSAFPNFIRPGSSKSNSTQSLSTPVRTDIVPTRDDTSPVSPVSPISPESQIPDSEQATTSHRAVSVSRPDASSPVQYPVIRPPTASGSWAESTEAPPAPPPRNPFRSRWRNPLSTVESVGMTDRSSGSLRLADSSHASKISNRTANSQSKTPPLPVLPLSSHPPRRDVTGSTIRMVNEERDTFNTNLAPVPGSRDQGNSVCSLGTREEVIEGTNVARHVQAQEVAFSGIAFQLGLRHIMVVELVTLCCLKVILQTMSRTQE